MSFEAASWALAGRRLSADARASRWLEPLPAVELVDRLRARTRPPFLRGWTLHTDGEPPYDVDPTAHDPEARVAVDELARMAGELHTTVRGFTF